MPTTLGLTLFGILNFTHYMGFQYSALALLHFTLLFSTADSFKKQMSIDMLPIYVIIYSTFK